MFFRTEVKSIQEQQLSALSALFTSYIHLFYTVIPVTTVSSIVTKLNTILQSNDPKIKVSVLFESLDYETLFTSESASAQHKIACFLRVHQALRVPVDAAKSRMSFLYLLDAAKKAMEEGTLKRETAVDIRNIIDSYRGLSASKSYISGSYGANGETPSVEKPAQDPKASKPFRGNTPREYISSPLTNLLFMDRLGNVILDNLVTTITEQIATPQNPSLSGYSSLS